MERLALAQGENDLVALSAHRTVGPVGARLLEAHQDPVLLIAITAFRTVRVIATDALPLNSALRKAELQTIAFVVDVYSGGTVGARGFRVLFLAFPLLCAEAAFGAWIG